MRFKTRYRFWKVLVAFLLLGFILVIGYLANNAVATREQNGEEFTDIGKSSSNGLGELLGLFYYVVFFYFSLNYFYNLIIVNKKLLSYVKVIGLMIACSFVYHCILYYLIPIALDNHSKGLGQVFSSAMRSMVPMFIVSFLIAYVTNMREAVKQRRILVVQKMQLEAQISQANFNFLKAQINPHFLHNTLNFLYAKSLPYSGELSEGILTLSDIMRYALSQGNQKDGNAPLKDEIEHVQNVIKISQLRYSHQLKVNFDVSGQVNDSMIIPFVLITLVENAFKHGELKNSDYPIDIKLKVKSSTLYFFCRNRKRAGMKQLSTGIGLDNIRKRLELAYGEKHQFIVKEDEEFYTTELIIDEL